MIGKEWSDDASSVVPFPRSTPHRRSNPGPERPMSVEESSAMSVIRVGSNAQYSDNWGHVFGKTPKAAKKTAKKATKKSAKKAAKKKG